MAASTAPTPISRTIHGTVLAGTFVVGMASADYHQKEARFLLNNPFEMNN